MSACCIMDVWQNNLYPMNYRPSSNHFSPRTRPKPKGGRLCITSRGALTGMLFVLKTGILWEMLPQEMGCGSGMTCWRCLRDWQAAGVWDDLHLVVLDQSGLADPNRLGTNISGFRQCTCPPGGKKTGPNPTHRGKSGSKRHLVVDHRSRYSPTLWTAAEATPRVAC
jgi:transposase